MPFVIEKNIPLPSKRRKASKYPWDQMKKGDSFFVPGKPKGLYTAAAKHGLRVAVRAQKKGNQEGFRVWMLGPKEAATKRGRKKKV